MCSHRSTRRSGTKRYLVLKDEHRQTPASHAAGRGLRAIPRGIWVLGLVSLLMDSSSELIHGLLPVFLASVLGVSMLSVGLIEGAAEAAASIVRVFSGTLSDYIGRRKPLTLVGYGLAAISKPFFPLAQSAGLVFAARFVDRIGKGIRGAPRDALIGEIAPAHLRGGSYGLRQSLDTVGALAGPLLAVALMASFANDIRAVFWAATIPAVLAVAVLAVGVKEPERQAASAHGSAGRPIRLADLAGAAGAYWWLVVTGFVLSLGRFSEAFLILRAEDVGVGIGFVPVVLIVMNAAYALSSYPAGALSDRVERARVIGIGCVVLIGADVFLAVASNAWVLMFAVALWGLHLGLTQGLLAALVADKTPSRLCGSAFGVFNLVSGIAIFLANLIAGLLWDRIGPAATFLVGAGFTLAALGGLAMIGRSRASA